MIEPGGSLRIELRADTLRQLISPCDDDCEDDCKDVEVQYRRKQLRHEEWLAE